MCNLRHALPRILIRLSGARHSRAKSASKPRPFPQARTIHPSVQVRGLAAHKSRTRNVRVREQSGVPFSPQQSPWQVRVRRQAKAVDVNKPLTGQQRDLSGAAFRPGPRTVRDLGLAHECPRWDYGIPAHGQPAT